MQNNSNNNDLQEIITHALEELKREQGKQFDIERVNLAELARRTGLSRSRLRTLKKNGFVVKPHGLTKPCFFCVIVY